MIVTLAILFGVPILGGLLWGLSARVANRRDPYRHLGIVPSHMVTRRDTGQEFER